MTKSHTILHKTNGFKNGIRAEDAPLQAVWDQISSLPSPVLMPDGVTVDGVFHEAPSFKTVTMMDGKPQFHGTVSDRYACIGHRESMAPLFSAIKDAGLEDGSSASWYGLPSKLGGANGKLRVVTYFPDRFTFQTGSGPTTLGLIGHNSLDGSGGLTLDAAGGVWVCSNRNVWGDLIGRTSIRHVGDASQKIAAAARFLDTLPSWIPELEVLFQKAGEIEIPRHEMLPLLVGLGVAVKPARVIAENVNVLLTGPQMSMLKEHTLTLEGAYNAATSFFTHHAKNQETSEAGLEAASEILVTLKKTGETGIKNATEKGRARLATVMM